MNEARGVRRQDAMLYRIWMWALACFVLAGATGSLLRFGMRLGYPAGLQMANIRHAHSHLMYFGWVTPAMMALILSWLPRPSSRRLTRLLSAVIIAALAAYVPFLLYGYKTAEIAGSRLPVSTIAAGLNVLLWYGFVFAYWRATRGLPRLPWLRLWDASVAFLVLASLGAWGLAAAGLLRLGGPILTLAFSHLFLDLFADGWFLLALLGLAYVALPDAARHPAARWGETLVIAGLPVTFLLSLPASSLPVAVRWIAAAGGILVGLGLAAHVWALLPVSWKTARAWLIPLAFLLLKAAGELTVSFPAGATWANQMVLRIPYLHWLLLGFVTLGLVAAAAQRWGRRAIPARSWLFAGVLILEVSLIPLTRLWPAGWRGVWALDVAAWATIGPVVVALWMLFRSHQQRATSLDRDPALEF
jgi:hypothetical protein